MLPPASDGHETPPLRSTDDDPDRPPTRAESDVLSGLVRMVTERATRLREATAPDPRGMDALREAVDAMGHYLDALELLRASGIAIDEPAGDGDAPPTPESAPPPAPAGPSLSEPPEPVEPRAEPPSDPLAELRPDPPPDPPVHPLRAGPRLAPEPAVETDPAEPADEVPGEGAASGSARTSEPERDAGSGPAAGADATGGPRPPGVQGSEPAETLDGERRFAAFRDPSSGLLSREGFEWIAGGELKRCARHGRVFSILLLQLGTVEAETLRQTAEVGRRVLRGSDVAGREGERAVVVALPETAPREARAVGERLIEHLEAAGAWSREGRIGMAAYPTHGETVWSLLETARGKLSLPVGNVLQRGGDGGYWSG